MEPVSSQNTTGDDSEMESRILREVVPVVVPIIFGLIVSVGLFGNGLVVLVVACNQQMRSTTNLLIINLAVADLLFITFCVPFTATGEWKCVLLRYRWLMVWRQNGIVLISNKMLLLIVNISIYF